MIIKIGFDIQFELAGPTPMVLMLFVHPSRRGDLCIEENLNVDPKLPVTPYVEMYGNLCGRVLAPAGKVRLTLDTLIRDTGKLDAQILDAVQHRVEDLPDSTLVFLLASRYCEVDKLNDIAWKLFGSTSRLIGRPFASRGCDRFLARSSVTTMSPPWIVVSLTWLSASLQLCPARRQLQDGLNSVRCLNALGSDV